jgi:hypothetical protein
VWKPPLLTMDSLDVWNAHATGLLSSSPLRSSSMSVSPRNLMDLQGVLTKPLSSEVQMRHGR